jgi:hypothetical protein
MESLAIVVKASGTAVRFVEGGPLAEALAELNLTAARTALLKAYNAVDKRAQVWSAVNHLEGAVAALDSKLRGGRGKAQYFIRPNNWSLLTTKRSYTLALMAICYRYLNEEELAQRAVAMGRAAEDLWQGGAPEGMSLWSALPTLVTAIVNPVDVVRREEGELKYRVNWKQFELPPRGLTNPGGEPLI